MGHMRVKGSFLSFKTYILKVTLKVMNAIILYQSNPKEPIELEIEYIIL